MKLQAEHLLALIFFLGLSTLLTPSAHGAEGQTKLSRNLKPTQSAVPTVPRDFTAHLTVDSRTRAVGKVSLQRAPGANINTGFLLSSLTVAVAPRLELGTMPIFYTHDLHRYNYNLKWNFWRSETIDWSLGYSQLKSKLQTDDADQVTPELQFENSAAQITFNLHPDWTKFILSASYTGALSRVTGDSLIVAYTVRQISDLAFDLSYPVLQRLDITVGAGTLRQTGFSAYEDRTFGYGITSGIYFPRAFLSKIAAGTHYSPSKKDLQALLGLNFM